MKGDKWSFSVAARHKKIRSVCEEANECVCDTIQKGEWAAARGAEKTGVQK